MFKYVSTSCLVVQTLVDGYNCSISNDGVFFGGKDSNQSQQKQLLVYLRYFPERPVVNM